jgi:drug/metabolite transporter (DMT)-like permease
MPRPDRTTLLAFLVVIIIGGSNAVAVRFSNLELPPFWGAAARFALAAVIFWIIVFSLKIAVPKGRGLLGAIVYGMLTVGLSYAFLYWALLEAPASLSMVVLALVPLLTFFFALAHRLEKFRGRGLFGALVALAGILVVGRDGLVAQVPLLSLLALVAGAACLAEGTVLFKLFPKSHPVATNAVAVTSGSILLTGLSLVTGEAWILPATSKTWMAYTYLVLAGTVLLFYLYLFVLGRWTASATSYSFLLFPISTIIIASWLAGEQISASVILGGLLVLAGVWLGALSGSKPAPAPERRPAPEGGGSAG